MDTEDAECANNGRKRNHFIQKVYPSNFPGITYAHAEFKMVLRKFERQRIFMSPQ